MDSRASGGFRRKTCGSEHRVWLADSFNQKTFYDVESFSVKKFVREELSMPFPQIVTDYSPADAEQLKVRIEAFLEMLR